MRQSFILAGWFALAPLLLVACGKDRATVDAAASASAAMSDEKATVTLQPRMGGKVVALGDYTGEVMLHADGQVEALMMNRSGEPLAAPTEASLTVKATAAGGVEAPIKLAWDPKYAKFVGNAAAGVKLVSGPVTVDFALQGKTAQGMLALVPLVNGPRFGGQLLTVGNLGAEVAIQTNGLVETHLWDAKLEPLTAKVGAKVEAAVKLSTGAVQTVALDWNESTAHFEGKVDLRGALAPVALELRVNQGGTVNTGAMVRLVLAGEAHHGGSVLAVGDYSAELLAAANGVVEAFVMDASGKAHASGDLGVSLDVAAMPTAKLQWDASSACYRAKLAAGAALATRPVILNIESAGHVYVGALAMVKVSADSDFAARARAMAAQTAGVQGKANASLSVEPPKIHVTPPKLEANARLSLDTANGALASAKAGVKAPTANVKPPSVSAKVGAGASAKANARTGAKGGVKLGL